MTAGGSNPAISSPANARIKAVAGLRDRRQRERTGLTIVDGSREIRRAIEAGVTIEESFVCEALIRDPQARATIGLLAAAGRPPTTVSEIAFGKIAFGDRAEGLVAVARVPSTALSDLRLPADPLVVVLEAVEKPGNVGAVLRSADGAGANALIAADARTDLFNPNAIRASLGTAFSLPLAAAPSAAALAFLREAGLRIVAARTDASDAYTDVDLSGPVAIVLGSESRGLSGIWQADGVVAARLPMLGMADSLNVSAAAAVLLYEARRQRGAGRSE